MKILVVIYEFPPIGGGGGRAAYDICKELVLRGNEVSVITAHMRGLAYQSEIHGIHIFRIPSLRKEAFRAGFATMLAYILTGFWVGLYQIKRDRPDIIHCHFAVPSGVLAWLLSVLTNIPYILTTHLGDVPGGVPEKTGKWFRWLKPFTYPIWKHAKRVIAVSEHTRQLALQQYPVDIEVIPNGMDVTYGEASKIIIHSPPRLVFAGRFVLQKNPLAIVETLSHLKDIEWNCSMLGNGPLFEDVKREIKKAGMAERFDLPGWVTPEDVLDRFSKSDILFMPSLSEGMPVVGIQALTNGLAIVASRIGGFLDLVDHKKNGYLIDAEEGSTFSKVLRELINNPEHLLALRKASREKSQQFDIQKIVNRYQTILNEVLNVKSCLI